MAPLRSSAPLAAPLRLAVALVLGLTGLAACAGQSSLEREPRPDLRVGGPAASAGLTRAWAMAGSTGGEGSVDALPVGSGWGPTEAEVDRARRVVDGMSLPQRAGQVLVAHWSGTRAPTGLVRRLHLGGVIAFPPNITSNDQVRSLNRTLQRSVREAGRPHPLLVGVDQEGGVVERLTTATRFPAFMTAGAAGRPALTREAAAASGAELAGLGFTTDFAPSGDVTIGRADPTIGSRSAGGRPRLVAGHTVASARGYGDSGLLTAVKHFPGHGSLTTDSHLGLPRQDRSLAELRSSDLVPFRAAVEAGLPSVMVGHIDVRAVDPGVPATLSRPVVTGLLREELGFDGLVMTDALNMQAVAERWGSGPAAVRALRAGADVLLMPPSPAEARAGVVRAVNEGRLSRRRLDQAAVRVVATLLHQRAEGVTTAAPGSARPVSARWSASALTSVSGPCSGRLVGGRVRPMGPSSAVASFRAAAADAGLPVGPRGETVRLVGYGGEPARGDVVVALDTPHVLGPSSAPVRLATYGQTPGAMRALVGVLLGRQDAPGRLPVGVAGVPRRGC